MNPKRMFMIVVAMMLTTPGSAGVPERQEIDEVFAAYDNTRSPGCSMAVFRDGEMSYARGYGMANLEYGIANGSDTVFRIGSTSKQFTAMAIALLAEQGALSLDDDIHRFFPEMPDYGEPVTVRQLIHHTSGLRDYLELAWLADWTETFSVDEALQMIFRQQELNFPPGTDYLYSNTGYFLLSQIVEIVTEKTLKEWAEENIFGPLEMTSTHFHDDHTHIVKNRADGYDSADDGTFRISMTILDMVGDGGVFTTVEDLLKWDRNFYDNRLGQAEHELIERVETPGSLKSGDAMTYAFGLNIGEYQGVREITHGGAYVGYRAGLNRYPEHGLSVAVLCNYANTNPTILARRVAGLFLGLNSEADISEEHVDESPEDANAAPSTDAVLEFAGSYYSEELDYLLVLAADGENLVADRRNGEERFSLLEEDTLKTKSGLVIAFERNADGDVSESRLHVGRVRNVRFVRQ